MITSRRGPERPGFCKHEANKKQTNKSIFHLEHRCGGGGGTEDPLLCRKETERSLFSQEATKIIWRVDEEEKDIECFQNPRLSLDWSLGTQNGGREGGWEVK